MDAALRAIAEPRRREILALIAARELAAGQIAKHFAVTRPAISQHLAVLKDAGLATERREGTRRMYRARPQGFADLRAYLEAFWDVKLRHLKHIIEADERGSRRHADSRHASNRTRNNDKSQS